MPPSKAAIGASNLTFSGLQQSVIDEGAQTITAINQTTAITEWLDAFQQASRPAKKQMIQSLADDPNLSSAKFFAITSNPEVTKFIPSTKATQALVYLTRNKLISRQADALHDLSIKTFQNLDLDDADTLDNYNRFHNSLTSHVSRQILSQDTALGRVEALQHWIEVANTLSEKGDINAAMGIIKGVEKVQASAKTSYQAVSREHLSMRDKLLNDFNDEIISLSLDRASTVHIPNAVKIGKLMEHMKNMPTDEAKKVVFDNIQQNYIQPGKANYQASEKADHNRLENSLMEPLKKIDMAVQQNKKQLVRARFNDSIKNYDAKLKTTYRESAEYTADLAEHVSPKSIQDYLSDKTNYDSIKTELEDEFANKQATKFKQDESHLDQAFQEILSSDETLRDNIKNGAFGEGLDPDNLNPEMFRKIQENQKLKVASKVDKMWERHQGENQESLSSDSAKYVQDNINDRVKKNIIKQVEPMLYAKYKIKIGIKSDDDLFEKFEEAANKAYTKELVETTLKTKADSHVFNQRKDEIGERQTSNRLGKNENAAIQKDEKNLAKACKKQFSNVSPAQCDRALEMQEQRKSAETAKESKTKTSETQTIKPSVDTQKPRRRHRSQRSHQHQSKRRHHRASKRKSYPPVTPTPYVDRTDEMRAFLEGRRPAKMQRATPDANAQQTKQTRSARKQASKPKKAASSSRSNIDKMRDLHEGRHIDVYKSFKRASQAKHRALDSKHQSNKKTSRTHVQTPNSPKHR